MKRHIITTVSAVFALSIIATAQQSFETGFFLDNYSYGHRINPSFRSESNVLGVFVSNISATTSSNIGVGNLYFPVNGGLVLGLNSAVSSDEFLQSIKKHNNVLEDLNVNIVTAGFWDKERRYYQTVEVNVREYATASVPYEAFEFLKCGGDRMYNISNMMADASSYIELAYGQSRKIGDVLTVGARAKALLGTGSAKLQSNVFNLGQSGDNLMVQTDNLIYAALPGLELPLTADGYYDFDRAKVNGFGISGLGLGIDLGATYIPCEGLVTSLSVNDIGGICWNYGNVGRNVENKTIDNILAKNASGKTVIEQLSDQILQFKPEDGCNCFEFLPFVVNGGVRYTMPFYKCLSAGVFGTYRNYKLPYYNIRLGATVTPVEWFSFAADYGYGSYGSNFGTAFTITGGAFNFFLGVESYIGKRFSDNLLPLNGGQITINSGITFRFGSSAD